MAQPTQPVEQAAQELPDRDEAYDRLTKAVLRKRAVEQLVLAVKRDLTYWPKGSTMSRRSVKVLDYMRGYIQAVDEELTAATTVYEAAIILAHVEEEKALKPERRSSLGRAKRPIKPAAE